MKNKSTAYLLWFFLGLVGGHCFYLGKTGKGILYIFTGGCLGIGWFIDLFTLGKQVDLYNGIQVGRAAANANANINTNNNVTNVVINMPAAQVDKVDEE